MSYLGNLFVAIDQLGNTIAGGNADNTISARVGYFSNHGNQNYRWYWGFLEKIINITFWPLDGKRHCLQAYYNDAGEEYKPSGYAWVHIVLNIFVIVSCIFLFILFYLLYILRLVHPRKDRHLQNMKGRLRASRRKLNGIKSELQDSYVGDIEAVTLSDKVIDKAVEVKDIIELGLRSKE